MKISPSKLISLLFFVFSGYYLYTAYQIQVFAFDENAAFNAKTFPIYIVDDWSDFDINKVWDSYRSFSWDNWELLDFDKYCKYIGLS